jgi:hypothetical protein
MLKTARCLYHVLDKHGTPVPEPDIVKWGEFFKSVDRVLKKDDLPNGTSVSTVFLGVDHNCSGRGPPVLWETVIFGGPDDEYQKRYSSLEAALAGHEKALVLALGQLH